MTRDSDGPARRRQNWFGLKKPVKDLASYPLPHAGLRLAARISPKLRSGRLPAPRNVREVRGSVLGSSYFMLRPDRCEIAKELYWGAGRRPRPEDAFAIELVGRLASEAGTFFDIGAYTGVFTLITTVTNPGLTAHAFEIVPAVADLLEANAHRNGVEARVVVHRIGVGVSGATMVVPIGEGGSALPSFYSSKMRFDEGVSIAFTSLDDLIELVADERGVVIKIDVEGTEAAIFEHGSAFLARHKPDILCELLFGQAQPEVVTRVLDPLGYDAYLVSEGQLLRRDAIAPDRRFRDWLFTSRTPSDLRRLQVLSD